MSLVENNSVVGNVGSDPEHGLDADGIEALFAVSDELVRAASADIPDRARSRSDITPVLQNIAELRNIAELQGMGTPKVAYSVQRASLVKAARANLSLLAYRVVIIALETINRGGLVGWMQIASVAAELGADKGHVSRAFAELEAEGFLVRTADKRYGLACNKVDGRVFLRKERGRSYTFGHAGETSFAELLRVGRVAHSATQDVSSDGVGSGSVAHLATENVHSVADLATQSEAELRISTEQEERRNSKKIELRGKRDHAPSASARRDGFSEELAGVETSASSQAVDEIADEPLAVVIAADSGVSIQQHPDRLALGDQPDVSEMARQVAAQLDIQPNDVGLIAKVKGTLVRALAKWDAIEPDKRGMRRGYPTFASYYGGQWLPYLDADLRELKAKRERSGARLRDHAPPGPYARNYDRGFEIPDLSGVKPLQPFVFDDDEPALAPERGTDWPSLGVALPSVIQQAVDASGSSAMASTLLDTITAALARSVQPRQIEAALRKSVGAAVSGRVGKEPMPSDLLAKAIRFVEQSDGEKLSEGPSASVGSGPRARNYDRQFDIPDLSEIRPLQPYID